MKTDRLQGIIIDNSASSKAQSRASYFKRIISRGKRWQHLFDHSRELEQRYFEVREDYAELIATDLLERLRQNRR